jgi:hypothetical protein
MDFGSNQGQGTYLFPSAFEPATYPMGTGDVIPGIKGPSRGNSPCYANFMNVWSCASRFPHIIMAEFLIKHKW